ncbi:MAG: 6-phosphogluconolactonase, partial [Cellulosimicrobium funkei]
AVPHPRPPPPPSPGPPPRPAPPPATPEESATAYAATLAEHAPDGERVPAFDVLLLGMGPDGHVASLFPDHPGLDVTGTPTAGVHGSPKPPSERVTLTFEAIARARQVWVVAAGAEKAPAVASALAGASPRETPAGAVAGTEATLWLVDVAAAGTGTLAETDEGRA